MCISRCAEIATEQKVGKNRAKEEDVKSNSSNVILSTKMKEVCVNGVCVAKSSKPVNQSCQLLISSAGAMRVADGS